MKKSKLLIEIDPNVKKDFKMLCVEKGVPMGKAIEKLLAWSLEKEKKEKAG